MMPRHESHQGCSPSVTSGPAAVYPKALFDYIGIALVAAARVTQ
jgi:hypothetical protein